MKYAVKQVPAPRFWQPNNPVVLMTGDDAKATLRHGQDGVLDAYILAASGDLQGDLEDVDTYTYPAALSDIADKIDALASNGATAASWGFQTWTQQPWNPFLLEWETALLPISAGSNLNTSDDRTDNNYDTAFITQNYEALVNEPDLSLREDMDAIITNVANTYSGRTILSGFSAESFRVRLETYLRRKLVADFAASTDADGIDTDGDLDSYIDALETWYEGEKTLADAEAQDALYSAIRAYRELKDLNYLSQSLG